MMVDLLAPLFPFYDKNASFASLSIGVRLKGRYKMTTSTTIIDISDVIRENYTTLFLAVILYKDYISLFIRYYLKKNNITNNIDHMEQFC